MLLVYLLVDGRLKKNIELINNIKDQLARIHDSNPVRFHKVAGHADIPGNTKADALAALGIKECV